MQAYLEAWRYAKSRRPASTDERKSRTQTQEALIHFIDNWTCDEFVSFVQDCEDLVNGLVGQDDGLAEKCEQVGSGLTTAPVPSCPAHVCKA